jgi:hypothetical protein
LRSRKPTQRVPNEKIVGQNVSKDKDAKKGEMIMSLGIICDIDPIYTNKKFLN